MKSFHLERLLESSALGIDHDMAERRFNDLHCILYITSTTRQCLMVQGDNGLNDVVFFVLMTSICINETHYILSFLWVYAKIRSNQIVATDVRNSDIGKEKMKKALLQKMRKLADDFSSPTF